MTDEWKPSACILCSINCGIEVKVEARSFSRIRGDKTHPTSAGYTCEKALRLDHYQNSRDRITTPLRRRADGTFEAVDWDTAIGEVAAGFAAVRDAHGGDKIFYYGGGGQGNHLGGGYASATRAAMGSVYVSNALAQEKTGEFWVDGQLFGRPRCHTTPDFEHAEVAVFVGKNPWQSHGFPRARVILKEIAKDPNRAIIVIDPRRTETADLADFHLQVRPGTDAWALAALLAVLVEEDLLDHPFLDEYANRTEELAGLLASVDISAFCERAGVDEGLVRSAARRMAAATSMSVLEDLGIQQAPHSTLNSWLEKLLFLLTGNFACEGGMNIHTRMASLSGGGGGKTRLSPVGGHRLIGGLVPAAAIPEEILTDHPNRYRAMLIESGNPVHSLPDSARMREALDALEFVVVIDVALTETARHAHYVLPAPTQYEKWECTFFTLEFPSNAFHLRRPLLDPVGDVLPEPEIHRRLARALGAYSDVDLVPLHDAAADGRSAYTDAFLNFMMTRPELGRYAPVILYETLGPTLEDGAAAAAAVWGLAQTTMLTYPDAVRRAGFDTADALFDALLEGRGVVFTVDGYDATWDRIDHSDGRINLVVDELANELVGLATEPLTDAAADGYPFILAAGERRSNTANTIYRDHAWRRSDADGSLRMCPEDAASLGVLEGAMVRVTTKRGAVVTRVSITDTMRTGHVSLPNGLGLDYPDADGIRRTQGVAPNELTASEDRDWLAGTPWHKHVRARVEAVPV